VQFILIHDVRFGVFTAVKIQVEVFLVVTMCNVAGYQSFRRPCCLHLQDEVNGAGKKGHRYRHIV